MFVLQTQRKRNDEAEDETKGSEAYESGNRVSGLVVAVEAGLTRSSALALALSRSPQQRRADNNDTH